MKRWPPGLTGPWRMLKNGLSSPLVILVLLFFIGLRSLMGLDEQYGAHPAEWVGVRLAFAMLALCFISRGLDSQHGRAQLIWGLGLLVFMGGLFVSGGKPGQAVTGQSAPTESYRRPLGDRIVPVHLGGQLGVKLENEGRTVQLSLGLSEGEVSTAQIELGSEKETQLGEWAVHVAKTEDGDEPGLARLRLKSRDAKASDIEIDARLGQSYSLPNNGQLSVLRVNSDFLGLLGGAIQLQLTWSEGSQTAWHFVESADLDLRHGRSPWVIEVLGVESEPQVTIGVRQAQPTPLILGALLVLGFALLLNFRQGEAS